MDPSAVPPSQTITVDITFPPPASFITDRKTMPSSDPHKHTQMHGSDSMNKFLSSSAPSEVILTLKSSPTNALALAMKAAEEDTAKRSSDLSGPGIMEPLGLVTGKNSGKRSGTSSSRTGHVDRSRMWTLKGANGRFKRRNDVNEGSGASNEAKRQRKDGRDDEQGEVNGSQFGENSSDDNERDEGKGDKMSQAREKGEQSYQEYRPRRRVIDEAALARYNLKMQEVDKEEELLRSGLHPDYIAELVNIEARYTNRLILVDALLERSIQYIEEAHQSSVELAHATFLTEKQRLRDELLSAVRQASSQLKREHLYSPLDAAPGPALLFSEDPLTRRQQWRDFIAISADSAAKLNAPQHRDIPIWVRSLAKKRKRTAKKKVFIPPFCAGLNESETMDDLIAIRSAAEAGTG
ncbi:hypothetical protein HDV05_004223 [Chytridiales sp. JEL 0842]|nr:hypothetical protein HDV05_004223 [Chytridiales sp. JEL 0842]